MNVNTELQYAKLDDLYLDAKNPRLRRHQKDDHLSQEEILEMMNDWVLDELAISYLESGFWTHEALLVVKEELDSKQRLVVVEGNRRLAALIYLRRAVNGEKVPKKWNLLIENREVPEKLFNEIPYIQINTRQEIEAFLAFHHNATGIKQWAPEQKAEYIASLINQQGMSYEEVTKIIGTSISKVQYYYISHQLFLQMEDCLEAFPVKKARWRFNILFFCLQMLGVQKYLGIDTSTETDLTRIPVPKDHLDALTNFARWVFGTQEYPPLLPDSRSIANFSKLLENPRALEYLENNKRARFDVAWQLAYGDEEIIQLIDEARNYIATSLMHVHRYKDSPATQSAVERLAINTKELLNQFPTICSEFLEDD